MNYKQKYEEALERAKDIYNDDPNSGTARAVCEQIFPELVESEDEDKRMIRIIEDVICTNEAQQLVKTKYGLELTDLADWLEKQVEPTDKGEIFDGYHTFNELYYYRMLYNAAFFNLLPKEWVHKSKRHHTGEECFGGGWFIVMAQLPTGQISNHYELKDWDLFHVQEKEIADEWDGHSPQEAADRLHKYLLEKQGEQIDYNEELKKCKENPLYFYDKYVKIKIKEQKPTDKAEPKFKVGDWIIFNGLTLYVKEVVKGYYRTISIGGVPNSYDWDIDNAARLWTIQDAKDGDVLANRYGVVFINAGSSDERVTLDYYCYLSIQNEFYINEHKTDSWLYKDGIKPATKEQCDLLFQKMHNAGYEWNAEKKELKKIEQEDDELTDFESALFSAFSDAWQEYLSGKTVNIAKWTREHSAELLEVAREHKSIIWSEKFIANVFEKVGLAKIVREQGNDKLTCAVQDVMIELSKFTSQPKSTWSEEDESMLQKTLTTIRYAFSIPFDKEDGPSFVGSSSISWLKSLKERYYWKPSDEQMATLWDAISNLNHDNYKWIDDIKSLYQDLQKLSKK